MVVREQACWYLCGIECGADSIFFLSLAMSPQEVTEKLRLSQLKDKIWYVAPSCATTGEGLFEGLVCLNPRTRECLILLRTYTDNF